MYSHVFIRKHLSCLADLQLFTCSASFLVFLNNVIYPVDIFYNEKSHIGTFSHKDNISHFRKASLHKNGPDWKLAGCVWLVAAMNAVQTLSTELDFKGGVHRKSLIKTQATSKQI